MSKIYFKMNRICHELKKKVDYHIENDDPENDTRIFLSGIDILSHIMTEKEYNLYEKIINDLKINRDKYQIYIWNDASGYDYWSNEDNGMNYAMITIYINPYSYFSKKTIKKMANDLDKLVDKLIDEFYMNDLENFLNNSYGIYEELYKY